MLIKAISDHSNHQILKESVSQRKLSNIIPLSENVYYMYNIPTMYIIQYVLCFPPFKNVENDIRAFINIAKNFRFFPIRHLLIRCCWYVICVLCVHAYETTNDEATNRNARDFGIPPQKREQKKKNRNKNNNDKVFPLECICERFFV